MNNPINAEPQQLVSITKLLKVKETKKNVNITTQQLTLVDLTDLSHTLHFVLDRPEHVKVTLTPYEKFYAEVFIPCEPTSWPESLRTAAEAYAAVLCVAAKIVLDEKDNSGMEVGAWCKAGRDGLWFTRFFDCAVQGAEILGCLGNTIDSIYRTLPEVYEMLIQGPKPELWKDEGW